MLGVVHTYRRSEHQYDDYKHRGKDLLAFFFQDIGDDIEGIELGIDLEESEYPDYTEHSEYDKSRKEVEREYSQQVDHAVIGYEEPKPRSPEAFIRIKQVGCPDTQNVLNAENYNCHRFYGSEHC